MYTPRWLLWRWSSGSRVICSHATHAASTQVGVFSIKLRLPSGDELPVNVNVVKR